MEAKAEREARAVLNVDESITIGIGIGEITRKQACYITSECINTGQNTALLLASREYWNQEKKDGEMEVEKSGKIGGLFSISN